MHETMELLCPACGWSKSCGPLAMLEQLRSVQMLRAGAIVEPAMLTELFVAAAGKSTCPDCGRAGLAAIPEDPSAVQWPGGRLCEMCGRPIPRERLAALPGTKHCANCQQAIERGQDGGEADYCPRCGTVRQLRLTRSDGLTRYAMFCPACHR